ncbi:hypothetical protein ACFO0N_11300 [Halobium salinum]|uniref:Uncharacterized protein n=1 Tax=Halobium salinum TaxID=1364940 RepID=A0ABD5PC95_9EURY|nr:hypothetical protein [Halobium salinum]
MLPSPLEAVAEWILVAVRFVGGVGSVTLAAALVYLVRDAYADRRDAEAARERGLELQERQTKLLAASHEPVVRRGAWTERAPDQLAVELTNQGSGVARDLRVTVDLDAPNDAYEVGAAELPLYRLDENGVVDTQEADLRADETATFVAPLAVDLDSTGAFSGSTCPFSAAVEKLRYTGTREASVDVTVEYGNVLDERTDRSVLSGSFTLVEGLDFPAAMRLRTDDETVARSDADDGRDARFSRFSPSRHMSGDATTVPEATVSYFTAPGPGPDEYTLRVGVDLSDADLVTFTRGDRVVASVDTGTDEPVPVCGGGAEEPALAHGDLLHVHAVVGGNEVEIDCFAAPDAVALPPRVGHTDPPTAVERGEPVDTSTSARDGSARAVSDRTEASNAVVGTRPTASETVHEPAAESRERGEAKVEPHTDD